MYLNVNFFIFLLILFLFKNSFADTSYSISFDKEEVLEFGQKHDQITAVISSSSREKIVFDKYFPDAGGNLEVLRPIFIDIDQDDFNELVVVTREDIQVNEALGQEGYFYHVYTYDDIDSDFPIKLHGKNELFKSFSLNGRFGEEEGNSPLVSSTGEVNIPFIKKVLNSKRNSLVNKKSYLFKNPNNKTKMYLIKGDKVKVLDQKKDEFGEKWYFVNYKGKKDLNVWIKAESVDVPTKGVPSEEALPEPLSELIERSTNVGLAKAKHQTSFSQKTQAEENDTKGAGSFSILLFLSLLGLSTLKSS